MNSIFGGKVLGLNLSMEDNNDFGEVEMKKRNIFDMEVKGLQPTNFFGMDIEALKPKNDMFGTKVLAGKGIMEKPKFGKSFDPMKSKKNLFNVEVLARKGIIQRPDKVGWNRMKMQKGLSMFGDFDKDKVPNIFDCKPYDKMQQGLIHKLGNYLSGWGWTEDAPAKTSVGMLPTYTTQLQPSLVSERTEPLVFAEGSDIKRHKVEMVKTPVGSLEAVKIPKQTIRGESTPVTPMQIEPSTGTAASVLPQTTIITEPGPDFGKTLTTGASKVGAALGAVGKWVGGKFVPAVETGFGNVFKASGIPEYVRGLQQKADIRKAAREKILLGVRTGRIDPMSIPGAVGGQAFSPYSMASDVGERGYFGGSGMSRVDSLMRDIRGMRGDLGMAATMAGPGAMSLGGYYGSPQAVSLGADVSRLIGAPGSFYPGSETPRVQQLLGQPTGYGMAEMTANVPSGYGVWEMARPPSISGLGLAQMSQMPMAGTGLHDIAEEEAGGKKDITKMAVEEMKVTQPITAPATVGQPMEQEPPKLYQPPRPEVTPPPAPVLPPPPAPPQQAPLMQPGMYPGTPAGYVPSKAVYSPLTKKAVGYTRGPYRRRPRY